MTATDTTPADPPLLLRRSALALGVVAAAVALGTLVFGLATSSPGPGAISLVLAPIAVGVAALAARESAPRNGRSTWTAVGLACACAALAQMFMDQGGATAFPSASDFLSILFHLCLAEAAILALRPARDPRLAVEIALDGLLVLLSAAVLVLGVQLDAALDAGWVTLTEGAAILAGQTAVVGSLLFCALLVLWRDSELSGPSIDTLFVASLLFSFGDALGGLGVAAPPGGTRWLFELVRLGGWGALATAAVAAWYDAGPTIATSRRSSVARHMRLVVTPAAILFLAAWAIAAPGAAPASPLRRVTLIALALVLAARVGVAFFAVEREGRDRQAAEARASRARIRAITAQMNPHFLFNTLHSLSALLRRDVSVAESVLERLGGLLRDGLDRGDAPLPLADEWRFTESYLELERVRLGDKLRVEVDLEDAALDWTVPPFILQPLVENSIRHAIDAEPDGGTIVIRGRVRPDEVLEVEVRDSGTGATPEVLADAPGVGVRGVRAQLLAHCGEAALVESEQLASGGFVVRLLIPPIDI